jgi:hypothetical protein
VNSLLTKSPQDMHERAGQDIDANGDIAQLNVVNADRRVCLGLTLKGQVRTDKFTQARRNKRQQKAHRRGPSCHWGRASSRFQKTTN